MEEIDSETDWVFVSVTLLTTLVSFSATLPKTTVDADSVVCAAKTGGKIRQAKTARGKTMRWQDFRVHPGF